jgi:zona occludens toxin (predicted ATPase)
MEGQEYENSFFTETSTKVRDLEEKQRILKDRVLLIGQNMIEFKEDFLKTFLEIKKEIEILKNDVERLKSFLESASGEFSKFARKEDLEILSKQAKMFQPLDLLTKKDLVNMGISFKEGEKLKNK